MQCVNSIKKLIKHDQTSMCFFMVLLLCLSKTCFHTRPLGLGGRWPNSTFCSPLTAAPSSSCLALSRTKEDMEALEDGALLYCSDGGPKAVPFMMSHPLLSLYPRMWAG